MGERKEDEHGEYRTDAGSPHPVDPEDVPYDPCNAVLKYTWSRYGERRYCTGMAVSNFTKHDVETDYEYDDFCKHHQARGALMKARAEDYKTGAYSMSHEHMFQHMPPHKRLLANDLYSSLLSESTYDFETEGVDLDIDVRDSDFAGPEVDTLVMEHEVPTEKKIRGKALWFAALDFVAMEDIRQEQFRVASEEEYEGRSLAVGERTTYISGENGPIEVVDEHHLNLPLSRIQKDYKRHLEFGGVQMDTGDDSAAVGEREWVVMMDEPSPQPEAASSDSSPLHGADASDIESLDGPDAED